MILVFSLERLAAQEREEKVSRQAMWKRRSSLPIRIKEGKEWNNKLEVE